MHVSMLLDMAADGFGDRVAVGSRTAGLTYAGLADRARRTADWIGERSVERVALVDTSSEALPILLFGAAVAGVPFAPLNYRLADDRLAAIIARTAPSVVIVDGTVEARVGAIEGVEFVTRSAFLAAIDQRAAPAEEVLRDPDDIAILLFTSGTTGEPKAAVLRHRHLTSYVIGSVDFMGADEDEAALVSVPPYHVAGVSAVLTSAFAGRRIVYLPAFDPDEWVAVARDEAISQAMVVPTMLGRILDVLVRDGERLPDLRHLSYGGGRMPIPVIERALELLPHVDFVNAYGLTETSSTVAVLGPEDHRRALGSDDAAIRRRLGSVGRPLPALEVEIRDDEGRVLAAGELGELWVRGDQVAGEYLGSPGLGADGWFATRDSGLLDDDGYLYLAGRLDDVIIRGAENVSPGEIEDALLGHSAVADAGVVGVPDPEWGEIIVAAVVLQPGAEATEDELQGWVRSLLRSAKVPEHIHIQEGLPYSELGKLLRRTLRAELTSIYAPPAG